MEPDRESRFVAIHHDYYPSIYAFIQRRVNDHEASQELAADVFRIVWQKWDGGQPNLPWLYSVARNLIGNTYRSRQRQLRLRHRLIEAEKTRDLTASLDGREENQNLVLETLECLKDRDRELLQLAYWEELSLAEIAVVLGISANTAKVRVHRARQAFRRVLSGHAVQNNPEQMEA
ncbi:RNA polymerase sigma factor [Psychromicrobium sp. YIM B11713]|uniref:RNA polymerase sigma factor n=1 Tax=Psychromicrobium sp. YIM B11713 TaxID=3145233 RepID=UPI00374EFB5A